MGVQYARRTGICSRVEYIGRNLIGRNLIEILHREEWGSLAALQAQWLWHDLSCFQLWHDAFKFVQRIYLWQQGLIQTYVIQWFLCQGTGMGLLPAALRSCSFGMSLHPLPPLPALVTALRGSNGFLLGLHLLWRWFVGIAPVTRLCNDALQRAILIPKQTALFLAAVSVSTTRKLFLLSHKGMIFANQRNGRAAQTSVPDQGAGNKG